MNYLNFIKDKKKIRNTINLKKFNLTYKCIKKD